MNGLSSQLMGICIPHLGHCAAVAGCAHLTHTHVLRYGHCAPHARHSQRSQVYPHNPPLLMTSHGNSQSTSYRRFAQQGAWPGLAWPGLDSHESSTATQTGHIHKSNCPGSRTHLQKQLPRKHRIGFGQGWCESHRAATSIECSAAQ